LDSKSLKCVFLGYKSGAKWYVLYDLHSKSTFVTKNVIFHENIFSYSFSLPFDNYISIYDFSALLVSHAIDLTTNPPPSLVSDNAEVIDSDFRTSHSVKNRPWYLD